MGIDPPGDHIDVESDQPSDLDERDATLVDQPADVTDTDTEVAGHGVDVDQRGQARTRERMRVAARHDRSLSWIATGVLDRGASP